MNMKKAVFDYRKDSGEVSRRKVAIIAKPSNNYFGLDLSDLDEVQAVSDITSLGMNKNHFTITIKANQTTGMADIIMSPRSDAFTFINNIFLQIYRTFVLFIYFFGILIK
jgi:hypothetical protein